MIITGTWVINRRGSRKPRLTKAERYESNLSFIGPLWWITPRPWFATKDEKDLWQKANEWAYDENEKIFREYRKNAKATVRAV